MSIVVVGSLALDTVKTPYGEVTEALGGSGTFFALGARHFVQVDLLAVIGNDFPEEHLELLLRHGVNLDHVERVTGESFRWGGSYGDDPNDRTTLFTHLNVFETWRPSLPEALRRSDYLFLANLDPDLQANVLQQVDGAKLVVCDTMNLWIDIKRDALVQTLKQVDVCFVNDSEARQLAGESNLIQAGRAILAMGPKVLVIKKGEHGALLMTEETIFAAPAYPLTEVFDPTGAGDTFAGGFLGYLAAKGRHDQATLRQAVAYGTAASSFCVQQFSVKGLDGLTWEQLDGRARELHQMSQFELPAGIAARS